MGGNSSKFAHPVNIPGGPEVLLENRDRFKEIAAMPKGRDAPIAAVYRMYAAIVCGEMDALRADFDYFWNHSKWKLSDIPNPNDRNPERYAFLAVVPQLLAENFNKRIEAGQRRGGRKTHESAPSWCDKVPSLETPLAIPDAQGNPPPDRDAEGVDRFMLKKNIVIRTISVVNE